MQDHHQRAAGNETTLRDFVSVVFRRKGVILTVLLAAAVTVVLLNAATPPSYVSAVRMLISRGEPESVFNTRYKLLSWEEELNSEIEVLQSTSLGEKAQQVLKESKAVDSNGKPVEFDFESVKATTTGKASVIILTYTASDPREAREALRALTRAYMDWRTETRSLPYVESFFQEELETLRERLSEWEQRRADFMAEERIINIPTERESMLRQREDAASQLIHARTRLADYVARLDAVKELQEAAKQNREIEVFGLGDGEFNDEQLLFNIRKELVMRRAEYFEKLGRYTEDHPEVRAGKELVDHLEKQLSIETENYARFLEARITVADSRTASLDATIQALDEELHGLPDKAAHLAQYDRIIEALQSEYGTLIDRHVDAKVESTGRAQNRIVVLQPASPSERQRTRDYVRLALVPLFALLIGLALAFILDGFDHSVKDATEAEQHLRVPVLGSLSRMR